MPYTFHAEAVAGEMKYSITEYKGENEPEVSVDVTAETWDRLLRAQQVEHLCTLSVAVDGDHSVGKGRIGTLMQRVNDIADEIAPGCDHEHDEHGVPIVGVGRKTEEPS